MVPLILCGDSYFERSNISFKENKPDMASTVSTTALEGTKEKLYSFRQIVKS